ncbi:hypothetical protein Acr_18g0002870 [Actinidia rufa]|uniref:Uncharacterized protein n=1 Tax=Actinidia rufa TaxID=165716 RepID=A0A7J0G5S0_9ERIC|nr:hypothetical protein Acr_18g0002870 [Actinidia rufa]
MNLSFGDGGYIDLNGPILSRVDGDGGGGGIFSEGVTELEWSREKLLHLSLSKLDLPPPSPSNPPPPVTSPLHNAAAGSLAMNLSFGDGGYIDLNGPILSRVDGDGGGGGIFSKGVTELEWSREKLLHLSLSKLDLPPPSPSNPPPPVTSPLHNAAAGSLAMNLSFGDGGYIDLNGPILSRVDGDGGGGGIFSKGVTELEWSREKLLHLSLSKLDLPPPSPSNPPPPVTSPLHNAAAGSLAMNLSFGDGGYIDLNGPILSRVDGDGGGGGIFSEGVTEWLNWKTHSFNAIHRRTEVAGLSCE